MQKKEKVVAIRLTQSEYETLNWARLNLGLNPDKPKTMSEFVNSTLQEPMRQIELTRMALAKKEAAAAKRRATLEAKKAAK